MSERTNDFFSAPLLDAVVIAWEQRMPLHYAGNERWYREGRVIMSTRNEVRTLEDGYVVSYRPKGYRYHNITNKPAPRERFEGFVRSRRPGARVINYYDPRRKKGENFITQTKLYQ